MMRKAAVLLLAAVLLAGNICPAEASVSMDEPVLRKEAVMDGDGEENVQPGYEESASEELVEGKPAAEESGKEESAESAAEIPEDPGSGAADGQPAEDQEDEAFSKEASSEERDPESPFQGEQEPEDQQEEAGASEGTLTEEDPGDGASAEDGDVEAEADEAGAAEAGEEAEAETAEAETAGTETTETDNTEAGEDTAAETEEEPEKDTEEEETEEETEETEEGSLPEEVGAAEDAAVAAGYYRISTKLSGERNLSVSGSSIFNDAEAVLGSGMDDLSDIFYIEPLGKGMYTITAYCSSKALTIRGGSAAEGAQTVQTTKAALTNQKWVIRKSSLDGYVNISTALSTGYFLTAKASGTAAGTKIVLNQGNGVPHKMKWKLTKVANPGANALSAGVYSIRNAASTIHALDVYGSSKDAKANVWLYEYNGTPAQQFRLLPKGYGCLYTVINASSGMTVCAESPSTAGSNVWQNTSDGAYNKLWRIVKGSDGTCHVFAAASDLALATAGGKTANQTNVETAAAGTSKTQRWKFVRIPDGTAKDTGGEDAGLAKGWYRITNKSSAKTLNVKGASYSQGAALESRTTVHGEGSLFYVEPQGNGKYKITSYCSNGLGPVLTWNGGGAAVSQKSCAGKDWQLWYIRKSKEGRSGYYIANVSDPRYVLCVDGGKTAQGTPVEAEVSLGLARDRWGFTKESEPEKLANGVYMIKTALSGNRMLTVENNVKAAGADVEIGAGRGYWGMRFSFRYTGYGNVYKITNTYSEKALAAEGGTTANGGNVCQETSKTQPHQYWRVIKKSNGNYVFLNAKSHLALAPKDGKSAAGTTMVQMKVTSGTEQQYLLQKFDPNVDFPRGGPAVGLATKQSGSFRMEVKGASAADGAVVQMAPNRKTTEQHWYLISLGSGLFKIMNRATNKVLDVYGGSKEDGATIDTYTWNGTAAQKWKIRSTGDGDASFYIINEGSGKYLTANGGAAEGTTYTQKSKNGASAQKFKFLIASEAKLTQEKLASLPAGTILRESEIDTSNLAPYFFAAEIPVGGTVYNRIINKSWRPNPDIQLSELRYLKMLHYNFNGEVQVGEMIVNAKLVGDFTSVFCELFRNRYQIRKMYLLDEYWTGDGLSTDEAAMEADNTGAFCYRRATDAPNLSGHAFGFAVDINPQENPFVFWDGSKWTCYHENAVPYINNRTPDRPHVITTSDLAYRLFTQRGFEWGGSWSNPIDYQHFIKNV